MRLARVVPVKDSKRRAGSRAGYLIYQNLIKKPGIYPWATNHTVQSWNNHYKKNASYYDRQIERYLEKHPEIEWGDEAQTFGDLAFDEDEASPPASSRRRKLPQSLSFRDYSPPDLPAGPSTGANRGPDVPDDDGDEEQEESLHQQRGRTATKIPRRTQKRADVQDPPTGQGSENAGPSTRLATNKRLDGPAFSDPCPVGGSCTSALFWVRRGIFVAVLPRC